jgi:hypothetical protein
MIQQEGTKSMEKVLQAYNSALGREAHILTQHPDLLWQQMHNQLKCKSKEALLIYPGYQKTSKKG